MRTTRPLVCLSLLLVLAAAIGIMGCTPRPTVGPAKPEKTLVIVQAGDIGCIDKLGTVGYGQNALGNIYEFQTMRYKMKEVGGILVSDTTQFDPDDSIFERWTTETLPDGRVKHTLYLHKNMKFHSGNPVTAHDVVWSVQRRAALGKDAQNKSLQQLYVTDDGPDKVFYAKDDYTVEYICRQNMPLQLDVWTMRTIFDKEYILKNAPASEKGTWYLGWLAKNPAASGPFKLESWTPGVEMVLRKFEDYWAAKKPKVDKIVFRIVPELASRIMMLKNGQADIACDIPPDELLELEKAPGVKVVRGPSNNKVSITFGVKNKPYDNVKVRQALSYVFPYNDVLAAVYLGEARHLTSPVPAGLPHARGQRLYNTDLEKAKKLLQEAGIEPGYKFTVDYSEEFETHERIAVLFQAKLREIGYGLVLNKMPAGLFNTATRDRTLGMFFIETLGWIADAGYEISLNYYLGAASRTNFSGYGSKALDDLSKAISSETDQKVRGVKIEKALDMIVADAPSIFIANPNFALAMRSNIVGYTINTTEIHDYRTVDKTDIK